MKKYILALDEGTTSARSILFDKSLSVVSMAQHEFTQFYPKPGWVEHDPMQIYASQYASLTECIAKSGISADEIAGIGITNQRETTVVWDKNTGKPVYNAIVWQCRRTADICETLRQNGYSDYIKKTTGLRIDAYFSGTKLKWILDNVDGAREKAERGDLLFGTVDTWLLWKLTDGKSFCTDRTNASRTMMCNLETGEWDDGLLKMLDIPRTMLPEIRSSGEIYGYMDLMGARVPICGMAGDQQAALFGQGCYEAGDVKNTYGTGCFLLSHTGSERIESRSGLITTAAATEKGRAPEYALEGSVFVAGAIVQWLRDEMRLISDSADSEYFARKVSDTGGVYIVPAFSGLGAPYWDMQARGAIFGLTRGTGRSHIIRAALESVAYQSDDMLCAMESDMGKPLTSLKVDGGMSSNGFLMQFQSDISKITVVRSELKEATAAGAAALAGLAVGLFESRAELISLMKEKEKFEPSMTDEKRSGLLSGWHRAVNSCRGF